MSKQLKTKKPKSNRRIKNLQPVSRQIAPGEYPNQRSIAVHADRLDWYKQMPFVWSLKPKWFCYDCINCQNTNCKNKDFSVLELFDQPEMLLEIVEKLDQYNSYVWSAIESGHHYNLSCGILGINILAEKEMIWQHLAKIHVDVNALYEIEISGSHRLWGVRTDNVFYPIWNDLDHRFYKPRGKNHTRAKH